MKRLAAAWCLAGMAAFATHARAVSVGEAMPAMSVRQLQEGVLDNAAMAGKVTIVNFWATWCAACKVELLEMEDLFKPLATEKDFQMAFVSLDKEPEKAKEWFQSHLKEPDLFIKHLYVDSAFETADKLKVESFPMTFVIGRDGKIAHIQNGFHEGEGSTQKIAKLAMDLVHAK